MDRRRFLKFGAAAAVLAAGGLSGIDYLLSSRASTGPVATAETTGVSTSSYSSEVSTTKLYSLKGRLFFDGGQGGGIQGNGKQDGDESGIPNSRVQIFGITNLAAEPTPTQTALVADSLTDSSGDFSVDIPLGYYQLVVKPADPTLKFMWTSPNEVREVSDGYYFVLTGMPGEVSVDLTSVDFLGRVYNLNSLKPDAVDIGLGQGFLSTPPWPGTDNYYDHDSRKGHILWWDGTVDGPGEDNHAGTNFGGNLYGDIIPAFAPGVVEAVNVPPENWVKIHCYFRNRGLDLAFAHNSVDLVKLGQAVSRGDPIAEIGSYLYYDHNPAINPSQLDFQVAYPDSNGNYEVLDPYQPLFSINGSNRGCWMPNPATPKGVQGRNPIWLPNPPSDSPNLQGFWIVKNQPKSN